MQLTNTAAWVVSHNAYPYEIKPAPVGVPADDQILIKNLAFAINPIDHKAQTTDVHKNILVYPCIPGEDVAGEVVSVGPNVTRFKVGDRVAGCAAGFLTKRNEEKAFQAYTVLSTDLAAHIPDTLSLDKAVTFPLGLCTAAAGLFNPDFLNLQLPTEPAQKPTGKALLVWGGASCVGGNAIQLGVAAGYDVITTSSPKHFDMMRKLGASHVFGYKSSTVVADLLNALDGKEIAGIYNAIGPAASGLAQEFAEKADGVKFIATVVPGGPVPPRGIEVKHVFSLSITLSHLAKAVWVDYLPKALQLGSFRPWPEPLIFGKGLESLQAAVDHVGTKGVSGQKAVVLV